MRPKDTDNTKWIQLKSISELQSGDIIKHVHSIESMIVTSNYGDHAIAIREQYVSNPMEWLVKKNNS